MLRTVADFLEAMIIQERKRLPKFAQIQHPGLFGSMYEGLTKALLDRAVFEGMDLRVVSGMVRNSEGILSRQIDCMVVLGDGEQIPHIDEFIYPFEKVVMVVEVKKTLYGADLADAMELFHQFWEDVAEVQNPQSLLFRDAWRALFKRNLPLPKDAENLPFHEEMIYHTLRCEAILPVRVVFGYEGYKDEYTLREGFVGYLDGLVKRPPETRLRFNINTFPNLIVCRNASLVKLDGMPYSGSVDERGWWWWMGSRRLKPFHVLLELLWTRLDYLLKIGPDIFGEDLETDTLSPFLACRAEQNGAQQGWRYENLKWSREKLAGASEHEAWHPAVLNELEFELVNRLCQGVAVNLKDPGLLARLKREGQTVESVTKSLNEKMLTMVDGDSLKLITDQCSCMILPDGRFVAAENKSGRLMRYALKAVEESRRGAKKMSSNEDEGT